MPDKTSKAALRKQAKRRAKYAKKVQSPAEAQALKEGKAGSYALRSGIKKKELAGKSEDPSKHKTVRSKARVYTTAGTLPKGTKEAHTVERPGSEVVAEHVKNRPEGSEKIYEGSIKGLDKEFRKTTLKGESADKLSTKARTGGGVDTQDKLSATQRQHAMIKADKLVTSKHKASKDGKSRTKIKTKFYGEMPSTAVTEAKKSSDEYNRGDDVTGKGRQRRSEVKVRGNKIIETRKSFKGEKDQSKSDLTPAQLERKAKAEVYRKAKKKSAKSSRKGHRKGYR